VEREDLSGRLPESFRGCWTGAWALPGGSCSMVTIREVKAKGILNRSKIFDYCLNPYTGCEINCRYCYARLFMRRYSGHTEAWGEFVDAKMNAPDLLAHQTERAKRGTVWISSVCDPYQPLEVRYALTRSCLTVLLKKQFPVNIQTKSNLVLRDIDLFREFESIEVGLTVTTDDDKVARLFEPRASSIQERIKALEKLHLSGIRTFVFIGPLLPGRPERLVQELDGKVERVLIDRMNYLSSIKGFYAKIGMESSGTEEFFEEHKERLESELAKRKIPFETCF
jgi:DNA repair photolyase